MTAIKLLPLNLFRRDEALKNAGRGGRRRMIAMPAAPLFMELDRILDGLFASEFPHGVTPGAAKELGESVIRPNIDISGDEKQYFVTVEVPGVEEKNLHVEVENDSLRIYGEKRYEQRSKSNEAKAEGKAEDEGKPENGLSYYRVERSYGSFHRALTLPEDVDASRIAASHKDGVLTITLPRKEVLPAESRRIAIAKE